MTLFTFFKRKQEDNTNPRPTKKICSKLVDDQDLEKHEHVFEHNPLLPAYKKNIIWSDEVTFYPINRICFRGDDRPPSVIFSEGFHSKPYAEPEVSPLASYCLVATSTRLSAAALFPLEDAKVTWVYVTYLKEGFDVHGHGIVRGLAHNILSRFKKMLFVDEIAIDKVMPSNIIGVLKIERELTGNEYIYDDSCSVPTGTYQIRDFIYNDNCDLSSDIKKLVNDFIIKEKELGPQPLASTSSGFSMQEMNTVHADSVKNTRKRKLGE